MQYALYTSCVCPFQTCWRRIKYFVKLLQINPCIYPADLSPVLPSLSLDTNHLLDHRSLRDCMWFKTTEQADMISKACVMHNRLLQKNLCVYVCISHILPKVTHTHSASAALYNASHRGVILLFLKYTLHTTLWQMCWSANPAFYQSLAFEFLQNRHFSVKPFCQNKKS